MGFKYTLCGAQYYVGFLTPSVIFASSPVETRSIVVYASSGYYIKPYTEQDIDRADNLRVLELALYVLNQLSSTEHGTSSVHHQAGDYILPVRPTSGILILRRCH